MVARSDRHASGGRSPAPPWQFVARALAVIAGLTLLLIVDVKGVAFYVAWALIVLALLSEATATLVYWQRSRHGGAS
jgi:hypothetical protein